jgi:hypothetical protein
MKDGFVGTSLFLVGLGLNLFCSGFIGCRFEMWLQLSLAFGRTGYGNSARSETPLY